MGGTGHYIKCRSACSSTTTNKVIATKLGHEIGVQGVQALTIIQCSSSRRNKAEALCSCDNDMHGLMLLGPGLSRLSAEAKACGCEGEHKR